MRISSTLSASMRAETEAFLRDIVFARDADYREFFTSTRSFLNAELASLRYHLQHQDA